MLPKLKKVLGDYAVVRLAAAAEIPAWATKSAFFSITRTADELSIVCQREFVPLDCQRFEADFCLLMVVGPLDFSLTGILATIANPLAAAHISIFALSTFDTDYILVKKSALAAAEAALIGAGFCFQS